MFCFLLSLFYQERCPIKIPFKKSAHPLPAPLQYHKGLLHKICFLCSSPFLFSTIFWRRDAPACQGTAPRSSVRFRCCRVLRCNSRRAFRPPVPQIFLSAARFLRRSLQRSYHVSRQSDLGPPCAFNPEFYRRWRWLPPATE